MDLTPDSNYKLTTQQLQRLNDRFALIHPDYILRWAFREFGTGMVLGTGFGPSGVFLIHRLSTLGLPTPVFFLDTHLLFDETHVLKDELEERYDIQIEAVPPSLGLDEQAAEHGPELWKRDPDKCCHLRKVLPLQNYLSDKTAWISGIRRSQGDVRASADMFEWDEKNGVVKINPLIHISAERVWSDIKKHNLPYNPLHDDGYPSIGCIPCTSKVKFGEPERAGRWKELDKTECGIHLPKHGMS
ncbi:phosphoadenylyl-sulfate reductase [Rhodohalobacter sp. 8-1]|uniref:phosphoadenylyl-sulfate reductase n=1 Tax=Rhodohalobacter sp. 8-1 TaxID=3131972 RepID=UPI0030EC912C